ncbi:hypothetical protein QEH59_00740 [Coraliomargarita sp. SDUM461004]|uniref:PEP-CTERM protein-sorting domain-containing protein n=1 Tax=Thalassobacterium sedimentorum TaxID=3041258 RepID=A0ABU1ADZ8_9BACT|nr:hypothetical protein [Coraliomargarita sp. SDUM461004]MDQ8192931.1 hypothetical protein [Coraliomargarita sp. SDUM461004]
MKQEFTSSRPFIVTSALLMTLVSSMALATDGTWRTSATRSDWSDTTKWIDDEIASGVGATATFDREYYATGRYIVLDTDRTIGQIQNINTYNGVGKNIIIEVSNGSLLTMNNGANDAIINNSGDGAVRIDPTISLLSNLKVTNTTSTFLSINAVSSGSGLKNITLGTSDNRINLSGSISDGAGQIAIIVDTGSLNVPVNFLASNTFSGDITIHSGTATTNTSTSNLGTGNIDLLGGRLDMNNANSIASAAILNFNLAASIELNYAGAMTIGGLTSGLNTISNGTYDISELNTHFGTTSFSGTGLLTIAAVPEASQYGILLGCLLGGFTIVRRRHTPSKR